MLTPHLLSRHIPVRAALTVAAALGVCGWALTTVSPLRPTTLLPVVSTATATAAPSRIQARPGLLLRPATTAALSPPASSRAALPLGTIPAPQSQQSAVALALGTVALCVGILALRLRRPTLVPATLLAVAASTGERFDPLGSDLPRPTDSLAVPHGRLVTGALLSLSGSIAAAVLFAAGPALAEGLDFGFNYDFDVTFGGFKVDHRVLVDVIVTGQFVGFLGALIGGYSARQRKREVEELAMKLKQVNRQLRQQARRQKEGLYTPIDLKGTVHAVGTPEDGEGDGSVGGTTSPVIDLLKRAKKHLRDGDAANALVEFERALAALRSATEFREPLLVQRKAWRGIGGANVQLGRPQAALAAMEQVLTLTKQIGDNVGLCDAYGVIADIYTDLNQYDKAAEYYDLYIANLEQDHSSDAV